MESMDTARRIGGLAWVVGGGLVTATWLLAGGGEIGPITWVLVVAFVSVAVSTLVSTGRVAWWAARGGSALLGLDFLAAVADRLGLFGPPGADSVAWGSWPQFVDYTHLLVPWWPWPQIPALAATVVEVGLGMLLLSGAWWRWVGKAAAGLLFVYLVTMAIELGWGEVLEFGIPILIGGALLSSARGDRPVRDDVQPHSRLTSL